MRWCWAPGWRCCSPCWPGRRCAFLYGLLGGEGRSLANALTYSHVLFSGALVIWANFFLSALLRGGGDAATPGRYMLFSSIAQVPLSYVLALGIGDWPGARHGRTGAVLAAHVARLRRPAGARAVARQAGLRAGRCRVSACRAGCSGTSCGSA